MSQTCYGDKWGQDRTRMKSVFGRYEPCSHIPLCTTYHKTMIMLNLWQGNFGPSSLHLRPRDHSLCPKKMGTWDNYRAPVTFCCPDSLNGSTRLASHDLKGSSVSTEPPRCRPARSYRMILLEPLRVSVSTFACGSLHDQKQEEQRVSRNV